MGAGNLIKIGTDDSITQLGQVGIGTDNPTGLFEVYHDSDTTKILWGQNIRNNGNAAAIDYGVGLKLKISNEAGIEANKWAGIAAVAGTNWANRVDLAVYTNPLSTNAPVETARFEGTGDLDISGTYKIDGSAVVNQDVTTTAGPTFDHIYLSDITAGNIPCASPNSELVSNGGFASNAADWTPTDCTLSSDAGGESGNCLTMTRTGGSLQHVQQLVSGLVVGDVYELSAWIKSGTSGNETGYVQLDPGGAALTTTSGTWTKITDTFVATATSGTLFLVKPSGTTGTMLFDTVSVLRVPELVDSPLSTDGVDIDNSGVYKVDGIQVVGARVVDARADDVANSGDATTDGLIDALRDAMIAHGLIAAA